MSLARDDERLFEAAADEAIDTARVTREVMEAATRLSVSLVVETGSAGRGRRRTKL